MRKVSCNDWCVVVFLIQCQLQGRIVSLQMDPWMNEHRVRPEYGFNPLCKRARELHTRSPSSSMQVSPHD